MRFKKLLPGWMGWLVTAICLLPAWTTPAGPPKQLEFEAYLVWATNTEESHGYEPVDPEVRKKLCELPLKWNNYFEVKRTKLTMAQGGSNTSSLSEKCSITVTHIEGKHVEVSLIGKGKPVLKRTQPLPKGEMLVLGGNAPNESGWLVVLKRIQ